MDDMFPGIDMPSIQPNATTVRLRGEVATLRTQLREVKGNLVTTEAWLIRHGGHTDECLCSYNARATGKMCTCGWAEIEKELK